MIVNYNWLKEFVDIDIPVSELGTLLTSAGPEVVAIKNVGISEKNKDKILLGKIAEINKHPSADNLKICTVSFENGKRQIITNSKNVEKGKHVVFALPGVVLPCGIEIKEVLIRGEKSEGMLLAKEQLNLEEKSNDIWILNADPKIAKSEFELYTQEDYVIEIELTANRSDCLSVVGIAREIAAILGKELKFNTPVIQETIDEIPDISIEEKNLCPRYSARILRGVKITESPDWIKRKLEICGIRSINNVVDATNLVLLEYGHPMHAFDLDKLEEQRIVVRKAQKGEVFITLDGQKHHLDSNMLMIADGKKSVALAGIMGGENSQVTESTSNILLESAYFDPISIRKTSKKLGLKTEASYRFERTADWGITVPAIERATEIILMSCTPQISKIHDEYVSLIKDKIINIKADFINSKLGINLTLREIETILKKLKFTVAARRSDTLEIKVPTFRSDISSPIDIAEEVARIYGYNNIPQNYFKPPVDVESLMPREVPEDKLREIFCGLGFTEVYNYSFTNENELKKFFIFEESILKLQNPLTNEGTIMRNYLFPGLVKTVEFNVKNAFLHHSRFYEIGHTFHKSKASTSEEKKCGFILYGRDYDYYSASGTIEYILQKFRMENFYLDRTNLPFLHPLNSTLILYNEKEVGFTGEIHPDILEKFDLRCPAFIGELNVSLLSEALNLKTDIRPVSKFPPSTRDLSVVISEELLSRNIMLKIKSFHNWIVSVEFIDLFKGEQIGKGKKSVTFSITFQSPEKTLTDDEVNGVMEKIIAMLKESFGAELRE